jgi:hypothetical protein
MLASTSAVRPTTSRLIPWDGLIRLTPAASPAAISSDLEFKLGLVAAGNEGNPARIGLMHICRRRKASPHPALEHHTTDSVAGITEPGSRRPPAEIPLVGGDGSNTGLIIDDQNSRH